MPANKPKTRTKTKPTTKQKATTPTKRERKAANRWAHQDVAVADIVTGFRTHDRGQCIMACGTGKTIVGIRVHQGIGAGLTLVLLPSLSLVSQTLRQWRERLPGLAILAICSDATVGARAAVEDDADEEADEADEDDLTARQVEEETGLVPTTNATTVATWLRTTKRGVVFCTYQSSPVIALAQKADLRYPHDTPVPAFDLVVADEAHRCAGRIHQGPFGTIVRKDAILASKRLFMTATPRIFRSTTVESAQGSIEIASMNDTERFGPRFHYLSFGEAIRRGLLCDYQILICLVSNADVLEYIEKQKSVQLGGAAFDAKTLAVHVAIDKAFREQHLTKAITFHSRISAARDFSQRHPLAVQLINGKAPKNLWVQHMSAAFPSEERLRILEAFANQDRKTAAILTNAQCLTEGIDVASTDAVVFVDPRESMVAIVQAFGRAVRLSPATGKKMGTIVIPVLVADQETVDLNILAGTNFATVRKVIAALEANDERLGDVLSKLSVRGTTGTTSTDSGEVAPAFVTAADFKKGLKAGTMVEFTDETVVHTVKAGRPYDAKGRQIVVPLPPPILVSLPGKGRAADMGAQFAAAICNRVVNSKTPNGTPSLSVQAEVVHQAITKKGRLPDPTKPGEAHLAKMADRVRAAGPGRGYRSKR